MVWHETTRWVVVLLLGIHELDVCKSNHVVERRLQEKADILPLSYISERNLDAWICCIFNKLLVIILSSIIIFKHYWPRKILHVNICQWSWHCSVLLWRWRYRQSSLTYVTSLVLEWLEWLMSSVFILKVNIKLANFVAEIWLYQYIWFQNNHNVWVI